MLQSAGPKRAGAQTSQALRSGLFSRPKAFQRLRVRPRFLGIAHSSLQERHQVRSARVRRHAVLLYAITKKHAYAG
jgi:hypothetical protein